MASDEIATADLSAFTPHGLHGRKNDRISIPYAPISPMLPISCSQRFTRSVLFLFRCDQLFRGRNDLFASRLVAGSGLERESLNDPSVLISDDRDCIVA